MHAVNLDILFGLTNKTLAGYAITSATQVEFAKVSEAKYEESKCKMQEVIDNATKDAPAGSEAAGASLQSAMAATSTLYVAMQQTAQQAVEVAESNWNNAAFAASNAGQHATRQAARAAKR